MKLSQFHKLIDYSFLKGEKERDPMTCYLSPAEYFAYKFIADIQSEIKARMEAIGEIDWMQDEAKAKVHDNLEELHEWISITLGAEEAEPLWDSTDSPIEIPMVIEIDEK